MTRLRRVLLAGVLLSGLLYVSSSAQPSVQHFDMPWGYVELSNNEVSIVSTVPDPPKVRMAAPEGISLGAMSWGRLRADGHTIDEMVLVQGKQDERTRALGRPYNLAGEFTIHLNDGGDQDANMVPVVQGRWDCVMVKGINWGMCP